ETWTVLARLAEALHEETLAAERALVESPAALAELGLPGTLRRTFARVGAAALPTDAPRVSRFDSHHSTEGWRVSEVNSDVPGGYIEATGFAATVAEHVPGAELSGDPAAALAAALAARVPRGGRVGLVHATAYTDDRQVMVFLARRLA